MNTGGGRGRCRARRFSLFSNVPLAGLTTPVTAIAGLALRRAEGQSHLQWDHCSELEKPTSIFTSHPRNLTRIGGQNPAEIPVDYAASGCDANDDGEIGLEEAIYILHHVAGMR